MSSGIVNVNFGIFGRFGIHVDVCVGGSAVDFVVGMVSGVPRFLTSRSHLRR